MQVKATKTETVNVHLSVNEMKSVANEYMTKHAHFTEILSMLTSKYIKGLRDCDIETYRTEANFCDFGHYVKHYHGNNSWERVRVMTEDEKELFNAIDQVSHQYFKMKLKSEEK
jgi:hypothetical protein